MNHQKIIYFIILTIFTIFYTACSTKKVELPKEEKIEKAPIGSDRYKLEILLKKLVDKCEAKTIYDHNNTMFVKQYPTYIHLNLGNKDDFRNGSYIVLKESKEKLKCIIPILKEYDDLYIVITGHADSKKETSKKQHLSDNRAITVAEEFFDAGIRDEIFVKGCSDKTLEIDAYHKFSGKKVNFYIYADKSNIKNHCK
jgi:outer membrane protein OmpA-like peptidoglycan-associated protein